MEGGGAGGDGAGLPVGIAHCTIQATLFPVFLPDSKSHGASDLQTCNAILQACPPIRAVVNLAV